jgi:uncharacterized protein YcnI
MAHRPKLIPRLLAGSLTTATALLAFTTPAAAEVSIVPDHTADGGTQTFAFRLADERSDTASTRLEIDFPQDTPVPYVEVEPVPGWTATITPRPLNPPVKVDGKTVSQVAASIVLQGGSVAPHSFETFPVTMGPLPANGRLAFDAIQTFANGDVQRFTGALSPVITFGSVPPPSAAQPAGEQTVSPDDNSQSGLAVRAGAPATTTGGGLSPLIFLWAALGLAIVIVTAVGLRARRQRRQLSTVEAEVEPESEHAEEPEGANQ